MGDTQILETVLKLPSKDNYRCNLGTSGACTATCNKIIINGKELN